MSPNKKVRKKKTEVEAVAQSVPTKASLARNPKKFVGFKLVRFPQGILKDIYGNPELLVPRMRWVNAEVFSVVDRVLKSPYQKVIVITDTFRLPSESYVARMKKGGKVAPTGLSGHNYGISWDIALEHTYSASGKSHSELVKDLSGLGLYPISREPWHFNLVFKDEREYFFSLFDKLSFLHKKMAKDMVKSFSSLVVSVKSIKDIQSKLGLVADGIVGKRTGMAVTMLLAEKKGLFKGVLDDKVNEINVNLVDVWE